MNGRWLCRRARGGCCCCCWLHLRSGWFPFVGASYCLTTGNPADRLAMDLNSVAFNQISNRLAREFAAKNNPNFTVVVQPGIQDTDIPYVGEGT
jgi:hypothetical protein